MLPSWAFWVLLYWLAWFMMFLEWYSREVKLKKKPRISLMVCFFGFVFAGFIPIIMLATIFTDKIKR